ncbi:MAG TPA: RNase adapter RapZ [Thermoanaerobaculia bacterium]|nr:RNase adapter RapZ [Thermoanaerobaculia bacterium]HUM29967.1 RNase adapter RapZ [Thermoanaerobaculia bacterium]HXK68166.1 RNase adapter RapZ [Thermoanaerobaculia bacterium]
MPAPESKERRILLITGLSGSGKSYASRALEDIGYYCVDNVPVVLIPALLDHLKNMDRIAISADVRSLQYSQDFERIWREVKSSDPQAFMVFLWAEPEIISRRYQVTRRPHPLQGTGATLEDAIQAETNFLEPIRNIADTLIETTDLNVHQLRTRVLQEFGDASIRGNQFLISITSFGFAYGHPGNVDFVMDVRFLPNPHFVPDLKPFTGLDRGVSDYVFSFEETHDFYAKLTDFMTYLVEQVRKEHRSYFGIGIGCTGGRHRSVAVAERLADFFRLKHFNVTVHHRDIHRREA